MFDSIVYFFFVFRPCHRIGSAQKSLLSSQNRGQATLIDAERKATILDVDSDDSSGFSQPGKGQSGEQEPVSESVCVERHVFPLVTLGRGAAACQSVCGGGK